MLGYISTHKNLVSLWYIRMYIRVHIGDHLVTFHKSRHTSRDQIVDVCHQKLINRDRCNMAAVSIDGAWVCYCSYQQ